MHDPGYPNPGAKAIATKARQVAEISRLAERRLLYTDTVRVCCERFRRNRPIVAVLLCPWRDRELLGLSSRSISAD
jgi:hypothetical protein